MKIRSEFCPLRILAAEQENSQLPALANNFPRVLCEMRCVLHRMLWRLSPRLYACIAPPPRIDAGVGRHLFGTQRKLRSLSQRALKTLAERGNNGKKESSSQKTESRKRTTSGLSIFKCCTRPLPRLLDFGLRIRRKAAMCSHSKRSEGNKQISSHCSEHLTNPQCNAFIAQQKSRCPAPPAHKDSQHKHGPKQDLRKWDLMSYRSDFLPSSQNVPCRAKNRLQQWVCLSCRDQKMS